jgi:hypothetical protein
MLPSLRRAGILALIAASLTPVEAALAGGRPAGLTVTFQVRTSAPGRQGRHHTLVRDRNGQLRTRRFLGVAWPSGVLGGRRVEVEGGRYVVRRGWLGDLVFSISEVDAAVAAAQRRKLERRRAHRTSSSWSHDPVSWWYWGDPFPWWDSDHSSGSHPHDPGGHVDLTPTSEPSGWDFNLPDFDFPDMSAN